MSSLRSGCGECVEMGEYGVFLGAVGREAPSHVMSTPSRPDMAKIPGHAPARRVIRNGTGPHACFPSMSGWSSGTGMAARVAGFVTLEGCIGPMGAGLWAAGPISFVVPRPMVHGPAFGDAGLTPGFGRAFGSAHARSGSDRDGGPVGHHEGDVSIRFRVLPAGFVYSGMTPGILVVEVTGIGLAMVRSRSRWCRFRSAGLVPQSDTAGPPDRPRAGRPYPPGVGRRRFSTGPPTRS